MRGKTTLTKSLKEINKKKFSFVPWHALVTKDFLRDGVCERYRLFVCCRIVGKGGRIGGVGGPVLVLMTQGLG